MVEACIIDRMIPSDENPHEIPAEGCLDCVRSTVVFSGKAGIIRSAFLFTLAIAIHNFPEGIATVASAFDSTGIATSVALAVAIHNVPEGIAVALPLLYGTGNRRKAFTWALLSGLAEPLGALAAWAFLLPFLSPALMALTFAAVAGIMVYVSFDELLPLAREYGEHHLSIAGLIAGMLLMSLVLL
jgi:ZIP family zinc transporter